MKLWLVLVIFANFAASGQLIQSKSYKCGVKLKPNSQHEGESASGLEEWPWLATLVRTSTQGVINLKEVIGNSRELLVYLGKHNLSASEDNSEWFHPYEILIHPDWTAGEKHFDADIAILVAEVPIPFSSTILPVCLWTELQEDEYYAGTVVGWGASLEVPNQVQVQRVPNARCYEDFHLIASIASSRTFCASGVERNVVCTGDSGGGFYIETNGVWFIQGIVSATFLSKTERCDVVKYSLYTKINEFISWINVRDRDHKAVFQCDFSSEAVDGEILTRCSAIGLSVLQPSGQVELAGKKSSIVVKWMEINTQDTVYLPNGIGFLFPELTILEIDGSRVRFVERSNFENMDSLELLHLTSNPIANIPFDTFSDLKSLNELHISRCQLVRLHNSLLANNTELRVFNVSENQLQSLPSGLFKNNVKLEVVFATHNRIKDIDDQVFANLVNLQFIDLSQNEIQNIFSNAFRDLTDLRRVSLNNNKLKSLHVDMFANNIALEWVRVEYNQIDEFPSGLFRNHSDLIAIGMNYNKVKIFHSKFFENLTSLKGIDFKGMSIQHLPSDLFFTLTQFETFSADTNELTALHKDLFSKNTNLIYFSAAFNKIVELDSDFFKNNLGLMFVGLSQNRLNTVASGLFRNLENLEFIDLSYNFIETIPSDAFIHLTSLKTVRLNDNNIRALSQNLFLENIQLTTLLVFSNQIEHLPAGLFRNNQFLTQISFANNLLTKIETKFDGNRPYTLIDLSGNRCLNWNGIDYANYNRRVIDIIIAVLTMCK